MFCPKCGNKNPDKALFCSKCGGKINFPKQAVPVKPENKLEEIKNLEPVKSDNTKDVQKSVDVRHENKTENVQQTAANNASQTPVAQHAPVPVPMSVPNQPTPTPVNVNAVPKKKSKAPVIIIVVLIILVIGAAVAVALIYNNYRDKTDNNGSIDSSVVTSEAGSDAQADDNFDKELAQANEYIKLGEYDAARKILDEQKSTHPDKYEVYIAYADLFVDQGKYLDALNMLEEGKNTDIRKINEKITEINQEHGAEIYTQKQEHNSN